MSLAGDDINLKKLSLSPEEQNAYKRIESNNDLHKFVVTRTYLNLIMPLFKGLDVKQVEAKKCGDLPRDLSNKFVLQRKEKELLDKIRATGRIGAKKFIIYNFCKTADALIGGLHNKRLHCGWMLQQFRFYEIVSFNLYVTL